jgi:hypothetical protein
MLTFEMKILGVTYHHVVEPCDGEVDGVWKRTWDVVRVHVDGRRECWQQLVRTRTEARQIAAVADATAMGEASAKLHDDRGHAAVERELKRWLVEERDKAVR